MQTKVKENKSHKLWNNGKFNFLFLNKKKCRNRIFENIEI